MAHGNGWGHTCKSQQWLSEIKVDKKSILQALGCQAGDPRGVLHSGRGDGGMETQQFRDGPAKSTVAGTEGAAKLLAMAFVFWRHLCTLVPLQAGPSHPLLGSRLPPLRQKPAPGQHVGMIKRV